MHVIDEADIHDHKHLLSPELRAIWRDIHAIMPKARRFVFDREASEFAGRFIRDFGRTVLTNRPFAITPYEHMYIEYNLDALLDAVGSRSTRDLSPGDADERIGHLIDGDRIYSFITGADRSSSYFPVDIQLNANGYVRGQFDPTDLERDRFKKLAYTLGSTSKEAKFVSNTELLGWLNAVDYIPREGFGLLLSDDKLAECSNGTVRTLVALLLLLNRQRDYGVEFVKVPPKGILYKGKRRVYMAHSLVTLTTEDYGRITKSFAAGGHHESPRRHQVRGFFRHYRKVRGCEHHYIEDDTRPHHWTCQHCGQVRVWVDSFERGDAGKGYVTKEYVVTDPT